MRNNYRIKFFCRSFDLRLYRLSKGLYESLGYPASDSPTKQLTAISFIIVSCTLQIAEEIRMGINQKVDFGAI